MRGNPDDLANQLIQKVKDFCKAEIKEMKISEETEDSPDDYICEGRRELAESLLIQIDKWERVND